MTTINKESLDYFICDNFTPILNSDNTLSNNENYVSRAPQASLSVTDTQRQPIHSRYIKYFVQLH